MTDQATSSSSKTKLILPILLLALAGGAVALRFLPKPDQPKQPTEAVAAKPAPPASPPIAKAPAKPTPVPNLQVLAEQAAAPPALTKEQAEEEEETEESQIAQAKVWLESLNPEERVQGAEQLAAYPTKEAESLLVRALSGDTEADVRSTAAMSLGYVENPSKETIDALLGAVEDADEEVSINALSTLEDYLLNEEEGSPGFRILLSQLKSKLRSQSLSRETRETLQGILEDAEPN